MEAVGVDRVAFGGEALAEHLGDLVADRGAMLVERAAMRVGCFAVSTP